MLPTMSASFKAGAGAVTHRHRIGGMWTQISQALNQLRREWIRVSLAVVALVLLLAHGFEPKWFAVDTTSLGLLGFVLILLLLPQIEELDLFGNKIRFRR